MIMKLYCFFLCSTFVLLCIDDDENEMITNWSRNGIQLITK